MFMQLHQQYELDKAWWGELQNAVTSNADLIDLTHSNLTFQMSESERAFQLIQELQESMLDMKNKVASNDLETKKIIEENDIGFRQQVEGNFSAVQQEVEA